MVDEVLEDGHGEVLGGEHREFVHQSLRHALHSDHDDED